MPSNIATTQKMLKYAKEHKLDPGSPSLTNPLWGRSDGQRPPR